MPATASPTLFLTIRPDTISRLAPLLQRGFLVPDPGPITLYDFLLEQPGFDHEYVTTRIETIFINGCAADSLDTILPAGGTVALSAAMPGLAGAIFRKGGVHASLRSKPVQARSQHAGAYGFVTVKLFNIIATDMVGELLPRGILMKGSVLARFFQRQQERLHSLLVDIRRDTRSLSLREACLFAEINPVIELKAGDTSE